MSSVFAVQRKKKMAEGVSKLLAVSPVSMPYFHPYSNWHDLCTSSWGDNCPASCLSALVRIQSKSLTCCVVRSHCDLMKWSLHCVNTGTSYSWTIGGSFLSWISLRWMVLDSSGSEKKEERLNWKWMEINVTIKQNSPDYPSKRSLKRISTHYTFYYPNCFCRNRRYTKGKIPIGNVQAPVALSSSNKVNMMGKSFCLLSSLNMKPLSSCNNADRNEITQRSVT